MILRNQIMTNETHLKTLREYIDLVTETDKELPEVDENESDNDDLEETTDDAIKKVEDLFKDKK